jgi:hypothetical protein
VRRLDSRTRACFTFVSRLASVSFSSRVRSAFLSIFVGADGPDEDESETAVIAELVVVESGAVSGALCEEQADKRRPPPTSIVASSTVGT